MQRNRLFDRWNDSLFMKTTMLGLILVAVTWFINVPLAKGILLGLVVGLIRQLLQNSVFGAILGSRKINYFFFGIYFIGNFGMLAMPLYIGSVYPELVNVFGAAIGLLLYKIMIYVESIFLNRKEG